MELEGFSNALGSISTFLGSILSIHGAYKITNGYVNKGKPGKLESQLDLIKRQMGNTQNKSLKKYGKKKVKELEFQLIAGCNFNRRNTLLFEYCIKNSSWLNWQRCKTIRHYFAIDSQGAIIISYGLTQRIKTIVEVLLYSFFLLVAFSLAILMMYINKGLLGSFGFIAMVVVCLFPAYMLGTLRQNIKQLKTIIRKGDL